MSLELDEDDEDTNIDHIMKRMFDWKLFFYDCIP